MILLLFTIIYSYHGSEKCEKTSHASTNHLAICMHNEISIAVHSIMQIKLPVYRAAIL